MRCVADRRACVRACVCSLLGRRGRIVNGTARHRLLCAPRRRRSVGGEKTRKTDGKRVRRKRSAACARTGAPLLLLAALHRRRTPYRNRARDSLTQIARVPNTVRERTAAVPAPRYTAAAAARGSLSPARSVSLGPIAIVSLTTTTLQHLSLSLAPPTAPPAPSTRRNIISGARTARSTTDLSTLSVCRARHHHVLPSDQLVVYAKENIIRRRKKKKFIISPHHRVHARIYIDVHTGIFIVTSVRACAYSVLYYGILFYCILP